jgi:hypothetical protein
MDPKRAEIMRGFIFSFTSFETEMNGAQLSSKLRRI